MSGWVSRAASRTALVALTVISGTATGWLVGATAHRLAGNRMAPWIVGRASGVMAYLLLVALVLMGLLLSHPARTRLRRPSQLTRIRIHVALATFTLVFTVLHIVVLATDRYAGVGWWGSFLPMHAQYRPVAVTIGVIGMWAGLAAGVSASLAGYLPSWAWWPLHRAAILAFVMIWVHGVFAGSDTSTLLPMYLGTAAAIMLAALSRYTAVNHHDRLAEVSAAAAVERDVVEAGMR
jgi:hypothetical protein